MAEDEKSTTRRIRGLAWNSQLLQTMLRQLWLWSGDKLWLWLSGGGLVVAGTWLFASVRSLLHVAWTGPGIGVLFCLTMLVLGLISHFMQRRALRKTRGQAPKASAVTGGERALRAAEPSGAVALPAVAVPPPMPDGRPQFADDPRLILDYLNSLPLLPREDALRRYEGTEVTWEGNLQGLGKDFDNDTVLLNVQFDGRRHFYATVSRTPALESLRKGDRIRVRGTIAYLGPENRLDAAEVLS